MLKYLIIVLTFRNYPLYFGTNDGLAVLFTFFCCLTLSEDKKQFPCLGEYRVNNDFFNKKYQRTL